MYVVFKLIFLHWSAYFIGGGRKSGKSNILFIVIQFVIGNHAIYIDVGFKIYEEKEIFGLSTLPDASILQVYIVLGT
jgi:hypothetical protein